MMNTLMQHRRYAEKHDLIVVTTTVDSDSEALLMEAKKRWKHEADIRQHVLAEQQQKSDSTGSFMVGMVVGASIARGHYR